MFYKPLYSQLLLISVFFTFIIGVFPLAAGDTNDKDQNIDPLLAKVYKQENVSEWWVSEKLDGVRAIWNGEKLHFRSGKLISAPDWFTENFPEQLMDGELWMGRGTFEKLSGIVRKISQIITTGDRFVTCYLSFRSIQELSPGGSVKW